MAERKSIKNYDVLDDITGQEDDIALVGYKISNSTTKGVLASALGGSGGFKMPSVVWQSSAGDNYAIINADTLTPGCFIVKLKTYNSGTSVDGIPLPAQYMFFLSSENIDQVNSTGNEIIDSLPLALYANEIMDNGTLDFSINDNSGGGNYEILFSVGSPGGNIYALETIYFSEYAGGNN